MKTNEIPLSTLIDDLEHEDRVNLAVLLEIESDTKSDTQNIHSSEGITIRHTADHICEVIRWRYHSKFRAAIRTGVRNVFDIFKKPSKDTNGLLEDVKNLPNDIKKIPAAAIANHENYPVPTWNQLIEGMAKELKVYDEDVDLATNEKYICQDIIVRALEKMKPEQRDTFFNGIIEPGDVVDKGAPPGLASKTKGPRLGITGLTLASTAGFSLYTSSATALSFLAGSVGITLSFGVYTGLSSVLSFVTGPLGWTAMGAWLTWQLTSADWKKLSPAILYIINARARKDEFSVGFGRRPE